MICWTFEIKRLNDSHYKLLKSIPIRVRKYNGGGWKCGSYCAGFSRGGVWASGESLKEMNRNIRETLITQYEVLLRHEDKELGLHLQKEKKVLGEFLKEKEKKAKWPISYAVKKKDGEIAADGCKEEEWTFVKEFGPCTYTEALNELVRLQKRRNAKKQYRIWDCR